MTIRRMAKKGQDTPQYLVALTLITLIALIVIGLIGKVSTMGTTATENGDSGAKIVYQTVKGSSEKTNLIEGGKVTELAYE